MRFFSRHGTVICLCALLLILGICTLIMVLWPRSDAPAETASSGQAVVENRSGKPESEVPANMQEPAGKPEFTRTDFDKLTTPQVPEASTLQMSRKRAVMPQ